MIYCPALDGLRAVAVLLVLGMHAFYGHMPGGALGVDVFFALSGFLITRVLLRPTETLGGFYVRRAQRLLPALACMLILALVLWPLTNPKTSYLRAVLPAAFYVADFQAIKDPAILGTLVPTWSLSIEEQFYLVWPLSLLAITKVARMKRASFTLALAGGFVVLKVIAYFAWPPAANYYSPLTRVDVLLLGCALGLAERPGRWPVAASAFLVSIPILAYRLPSYSASYYLAGAPLIGCGSVAVIAECIGGQKSLIQRTLSFTPLVWLGRRSYGIYLYHLPIFDALEHFRRPQSKANLIAISALRLMVVLVVAAASYQFIERPVLAMRFGKRGSAQGGEVRSDVSR